MHNIRRAQTLVALNLKCTFIKARSEVEQEGIKLNLTRTTKHITLKTYTTVFTYCNTLR